MFFGVYKFNDYLSLNKICDIILLLGGNLYMNWNDILKKMKEINTIIDNGCDLNFLEENMQFALNIGNYYDTLLNDKENKNDEILKSYMFFSKFFTIYIAKKYNKSFKYELASNTEETFYNPSNNSINISKYNIGKDFQIILFKIFHEFKHKMQWDDLRKSFGINGIENIMDIDSLTILFLKEQFVMNDYNLYKRNHDCFTMEHDANLFSISECKSFFNTDYIEKMYSGELTNYVKAMIEGIDLSDQEYHDKLRLPIIYEQDYRFKKYIFGKNISQNSLLSLIYNSDGKPKTYEVLLEEKKKLIEKYKDKIIDRKTSSLDYQTSKISSKEHIEQIYKLIIASDPILTIQECLYKYNTIDNKIISKKYLDKITKLLDNCPQLNTIYYEEIKDLLVNELKKGNAELVKVIVNKNRIFENIVIDDEYDMEKEKIPFTPIVDKKLKYRPVISELVKKAIILRDKKQKLQEVQQQLLDYERQIKEQEEKLDEEEINEMSM